MITKIKTLVSMLPQKELRIGRLSLGLVSNGSSFFGVGLLIAEYYIKIVVPPSRKKKTAANTTCHSSITKKYTLIMKS
jgi:hypothetical protein